MGGGGVKEGLKCKNDSSPNCFFVGQHLVVIFILSIFNTFLLMYGGCKRLFCSWSIVQTTSHIHTQKEFPQG